MCNLGRFSFFFMCSTFVMADVVLPTWRYADFRSARKGTDSFKTYSPKGLAFTQPPPPFSDGSVTKSSPLLNPAVPRLAPPSINTQTVKMKSPLYSIPLKCAHCWLAHGYIFMGGGKYLTCILWLCEQGLACESRHSVSLREKC